MPERPGSISIIMPAYREEKSLEEAARRTLHAFRSLKLDCELILVDDCSPDRTGEIADQFAAGEPSVRVIHHAKNTGVGGAVRTGMDAARKEFIIFIPVDNPLEREDLQAYLDKIGGCDIVVGVRERRVGYTPFARFASFAYSRVLLPLLFDIGVSDPNWIQMYRRSFLVENGIRIEHNGIFFPAEILIKARRAGARIVQAPARMRAREHGRPTCFRLATMSLTFRDMVRFYWRTRGLRKGAKRP